MYFRPQPPPPKDARTNRGLSANFTDSNGLPDDHPMHKVPSSNKLAPLEQTSEEPERKRKKKSKRKSRRLDEQPEDDN